MFERVEIGDCILIQADCRLVLPSLQEVAAIITDPPFGARRPSARRSAGERFDEVNGNDAVRGDWLTDAYRITRDGGALYAFTCWDRLEEWRSEIGAVGYRVRNCIVWDKMIHGLADLETCWAPQHELVLFAAKGRHLLGDPRPKDILRVLRVAADQLVHPYQKPTGAILPLIKASTKPGDTVLDCFMGSGTTGVVCVQTGRKFIGIENDPAHFATARRRIEEVNGKGSLFEASA